MKTVRILEYSSIPLPPWAGLFWMIGAWGVLVAATTGLLWFDADQEPYFGPMVAWQWVVVVAGGSVLLLGWLAWSVVLVWAVRTRRITQYWLAHLLWPAAGILAAGSVLVGYFQSVGKP